jgi:hypothetical protein
MSGSMSGGISMLRAMKYALLLGLVVGVAVHAGPPQLHGRIAGKQGAQSARVWTFEVSNSGTETVRGAQIGALQLTPDAQVCAPVVKEPARFPLVVGDLPVGGTAQAKVTIDFSGCANTAKFTVRAELSGSGGAAGAIQRSNEYR